MKMTSKGQVTIPANLRAIYGLLPYAELEFIEGKEGLIIRKKEKESRRGKKLIQHMDGTSTVKMTTDEIMRLTRGDND
jgi:bifunctional DNA-binding transcriptional regulator/antitoxin component of YhaV-PrlF toxin-antitoxin module